MTVQVGGIDRPTGALRWHIPLVSWRTEQRVAAILVEFARRCRALSTVSNNGDRQ